MAMSFDDWDMRICENCPDKCDYIQEILQYQYDDYYRRVEEEVFDALLYGYSGEVDVQDLYEQLMHNYEAFGTMFYDIYKDALLDYVADWEFGNAKDVAEWVKDTYEVKKGVEKTIDEIIDMAYRKAGVYYDSSAGAALEAIAEYAAEYLSADGYDVTYGDIYRDAISDEIYYALENEVKKYNWYEFYKEYLAPRLSELYETDEKVRDALIEFFNTIYLDTLPYIDPYLDYALSVYEREEKEDREKWFETSGFAEFVSECEIYHSRLFEREEDWEYEYEDEYQDDD